MANYYLRSTDGNDGNAGTPGQPWATLLGANNQMSPGDTLYASNLHSEASIAAIRMHSPGTVNAPCRFLCIEDWGSETDPGEISHVLSTGATVATQGNYSIYFASSLYMYGFTLNPGSDGKANLAFAFPTTSYPKLTQLEVFENCTLLVNNRGSSMIAGAYYYPNGSRVLFKDCDWTYYNAGTAWKSFSCDVEFINNVFGGTAPTYFIYPQPTSGGGAHAHGRFRFEDCDMSFLGTGSTLLNGAHQYANHAEVELHRCRVGNGLSLATGLQGQGAGHVKLVECDHGTNFIRQAKHDYNGTVTEDTVRVRDNSNSSYSHKLVSTANTKFYSPLRSFPVARLNVVEGTPITVRVYVLTDGVTLTDGDFWIEVNYLGSASYPLGSIASSAKSDILASASNLSTSTEGWTTTDLATPVKQYAEVTFTPQETGIIEIVGCLAKASTTVYVDPDATVS